ncbi:MAG: dNTP triphosphohydrolase, partial [Pseudomonadota bacterium]|nr:dNTP triphosphohydrolase [Pseudomonadota bacterium]
AQSLRIVTRLERRYADYDGLNLTWETLEGIIKHNGPLTDSAGRPLERHASQGLPHAIQAYMAAQDLRLDTHASLEAQAAAIADDIAYDAHDIDDGLRAGVFGLEEIEAVPFLAAILAEIRVRHPGLERPRLDHELFRRIITYQIEDVIAVSARNIADAALQSADDVRHAGRTLIGFSPEMAAHDRALKEFLYARAYRHPRVSRVREDAKQVLRNLFTRFLEEPLLLPETWRKGLDLADTPHLARRVCDYVAGMTDGYALEEHRRLFDEAPELR